MALQFNGNSHHCSFKHVAICVCVPDWSGSPTSTSGIQSVGEHVPSLPLHPDVWAKISRQVKRRGVWWAVARSWVCGLPWQLLAAYTGYSTSHPDTPAPAKTKRIPVLHSIVKGVLLFFFANSIPLLAPSLMRHYPSPSDINFLFFTQPNFNEWHHQSVRISSIKYHCNWEQITQNSCN